jgi:hypothetical protein
MKNPEAEMHSKISFPASRPPSLIASKIRSVGYELKA